MVIDSTLHSDIALPPSLQPSLPAVNGSQSVDQFYMLDDQKTGIMALGSFADDGDYNDFLLGMLKGLQSLKALGATQLIIDVVRPLCKSCGVFFFYQTLAFQSNNGGGYVCASHVGSTSQFIPRLLLMNIAQWLHRIVSSSQYSIKPCHNPFIACRPEGNNRATGRSRHRKSRWNPCPTHCERDRRKQPRPRREAPAQPQFLG